MKTRKLATIFLSIMPLFGCSLSENNVEPAYIEEWRASEIEGSDLWGDEVFSEMLSGYKSEGCQIKFTQQSDRDEDVNRIWGKDSEMGLSPAGPYTGIFVNRFYQKYNQNEEFSDGFGNVVDKTLIITSSYFSKLSILFKELNLYYSENPQVVTPWEIYFDPIEPSEHTNGSIVTEFERYLRDIQQTAKRLCYTGEQPTDTQFSIAQRKFKELLDDWQRFNTWLIESEIYIDRANEQLAKLADKDVPNDEPEQTVQCEEFETNFPGKELIICDLP